MRVDVSSSETLKNDIAEYLKNIPGTKEWTEARLEADKQLRQKIFIEKCEKLGISGMSIREEVRRTYVSIGFYALVSEQEYGIQQDFEFDNRTETILDLTPKVIEATKIWNAQLLELIKITAEMKGLL